MNSEKNTPPRQTLLSKTFKAIGALPIRLRGVLGYGIGAFIGLFPWRECKILDAQVSTFLPEHRSKGFTARVYGNFGQLAFESINLKPLLESEGAIECHGMDQFRAAFDEGKGLLALSAHTGNWDLLAAIVSQLGLSVMTIGRAAQAPRLQQYLDHIRRGFGLETVWRHGDLRLEGGRGIVEGFKKGHVVAALLDQDTQVDSIFSPFFGRMARTPSSIVALAKRKRAPIFTIFVFRSNFQRFVVYAEPIDAGLTLEQTIDLYHQRLEKYIRRYPDQWVWFHKRWRSTPSGHHRSGKEYVKDLQAALRN